MVKVTNAPSPEIEIKPSLYQQCREIDCSKIIRQNYNGIRYIAWADMWDTLFTHFPYAEVDWVDFGPNNVPYLQTPLGTFVRCIVTIGEVARMCELPVMGGDMKAVLAPDARDINDNKMRCFVKACALHGLGLSVYEKEDIYEAPVVGTHTMASAKRFASSASPGQPLPLKGGSEFRFGFGKFKGKTFGEIPRLQLDQYIQWMQKNDLENNKGDMNEPIYDAYEIWKGAKSALGEEPPPYAAEDIPF